MHAVSAAKFKIRIWPVLLGVLLLVAAQTGGAAFAGRAVAASRASVPVASHAVTAEPDKVDTSAKTADSEVGGVDDAGGVALTVAQAAAYQADTDALQQDATLDMQAKLNTVFERYRTMGAVVCVIENGEVSHTYCYGALDSDGTPMTDDALFRVGSISKMVTAMGIMQLVEQGRLTLDQDLTDVLGVTVRNPRYPSDPVTLRQLMTHTAGFRDSSLYRLALSGSPMTLTELLTGAEKAVQFLQSVKPGTASRYSNFGGGLLGCVIEQTTGQTVDAYMRAALFEPLGIEAAYQGALIPADATVADLYAMPARSRVAALRESGPAVTEADPQNHYLWTAGKLAISAPDLAKLLIALCDGGVWHNTRVLRESTALTMCTMQNQMGSVSCNSNRGLCMNLVTDTIVKGRTLYGHGGKAYGMLCAAYFDPTDRTGVVMLTNGCNNRPMFHDVGMLTIAVVRLCYTDLLESAHEAQDPWLVTP